MVASKEPHASCFCFLKPPFAAMQMNDGSRIIALDAFQARTSAMWALGGMFP